jgi:hypothetical protein
MRIDSNSIQVPFDAINHIDTTYLTHQTQVKNGNVITDTHSINSIDLPVGLSGIIIDNNRQVVKISGSAKLLDESYLDGVNINTFENYIDKINELGIVELDKNKTFESGIYHSIDTTNNIDMSPLYDLDKEWSEILGYLAMAKRNHLFNIVDYDKKHNQGITYKGDQKTEKNRLIMYRKYLDLLKTTDTKGISNKEFLSRLKNPIKFIESTRSILRVETNHTTFKSIRLRHKVNTNTIKDVLTNGVNYNSSMLDKITQPHRENQLLMLFNEYKPDEHSIQDVIHLEGIKNIIRQANYDEKVLKHFVKMYTTESMFRWWWYGGKKSVTPFRPLIDELKRKDLEKEIDINKSPQAHKIIEYIKTSMLTDKVA